MEHDHEVTPGGIFSNLRARWGMWLMAALCLLPLVGFATIAIFRIPTNQVLLLALALLCPLSHLLMMGMVGHKHGVD